jgi:hypothetical protein
MEQDTPLKPDGYSASQKIPSRLQNARIHYCVHRKPTSGHFCQPDMLQPKFSRSNSWKYNLNSFTSSSVSQIIYKVLGFQLKFYMHFLSRCPFHLNFCWSIKIFGGMKIKNLLVRNFLHSPDILFILSSIFVLKTLDLCSSLSERKHFYNRFS